MDTTGEKEKRTFKKNVDGSSTSNHDSKTFRTRSMEKQRGITFGFRKTVTTVKKKTDKKIHFKTRRQNFLVAERAKLQVNYV
jgi:hypothetical protein